MAQRIAFVTFGMFIIDEIEYEGAKAAQLNLIGGAGVYAALGARLSTGPQHARSVSWIVDIGSDFPADFRDLIESWQTSCIFRFDNNRLTTRAWNGYGPNEHRRFKYLTPKIRLEVSSLNDQQTLSLSFHMVCSPSRCMELTTELTRRRQSLNKACPEAVIVWEPIPDLCTPEELENLQQAAEGVTVVSPNADELASFFTDQKNKSQNEMVKQFMGWDNGRTLSTHAIIREGADGSTIYFAPVSVRKTGVPDRPQVHLPAYHTKTEASKVIDPTGGGNTYLGGLAVGMTDMLDDSNITRAIGDKLSDLQLRGGEADGLRRVLIGALYAVIAASFAIEQCGVPSLAPTSSGSPSTTDCWNDDTFVARMISYLDREIQHIAPQLARLW